MSNKTPIELLLIDDDQSDIYLAKRALRKCATPVELQVARDGEEALALLRREGTHGDARRPDLIILDLNMPRMSGHEFLEAIKADGDLRSIPIIVMSMSESQVDVQESYRLQASAYISKPLELEPFTQVMRSIEEHWFRVVRLPPRREG
ncbi:MAG: response regulator [Alphaproteobacteria bacterium]